MVDVSAGHEHSFRLQFYVITTNCTAWGLQRVALPFTVFLLYFDDWQFIDSLLLCALGSLPLLGLLLADPTNHLKKIIGSKALVEVAHEIIRVKVAVLHLHAQELAAGEHFHEISQQVVYQVLDM